MREALRKLGHEGLVTTIPRRGSFVTEVSQEQAEQAREVRQSLEELGARLTTGRLGDQYAGRLREIVDEMWKAAHKNDVAAFRTSDTAFHRTVLEASGNEYLPRIWLQIEPSLHSLQVVSNPRFDGDWLVLAQVHAELIDLLEGDDIEAAARRFREHAGGHALTRD